MGIKILLLSFKTTDVETTKPHSTQTTGDRCLSFARRRRSVRGSPFSDLLVLSERRHFMLECVSVAEFKDLFLSSRSYGWR